MLSKGNLTAREKFLLLIQNDVHKMKTGKELLTPGDKYALEHWQAKDNSEAREWNRLNDGWKRTGRLDIEAEFIYKDAQVDYLSMVPILMKLLSYPSAKEAAQRIEGLKDMKIVTIDEAAKIAAKQREVKLKEGMDFEYAAYRLAFEMLDPKDRKRLNELYDDVETDHQYLDQEEVIASLYGGKKELSPEAKEKLASLIAEWSYNKFAKEYQLFHYYGPVPLVEVAKRFLAKKGIPVPEKDKDDSLSIYDEIAKLMKSYAEQHQTTVKAILKEECLTWLDHGLTETYWPLALSNEADLFARWLKAKQDARKALEERVRKGILKLRRYTDQETRKEKLYSKGLHTSEMEVARRFFEGVEPKPKGELDEKVAFENFDGEVLTGESLYALEEGWEFLKDFKERVDTYDPNLGIVYADDDPEHKGEHLDQEFVICGRKPSGEAAIFSLYGLTVEMLLRLSEVKMILKEKRVDGKTILKFKDSGLKEGFKMRRMDLIDGYAKLLAFEGLLARLEKEYETDLTLHLKERLALVRSYLEHVNEAIQAVTDASRRKSRWSREANIELELEEDFLIDIDAIKPDEAAVKEHEEEFLRILGDF